MQKYMGIVEKEGLEEEYEEVGIRRNLAKESYEEIKTIIKDLEPMKMMYEDMIKLIPKFGDEYDALGRNTKVNIEAFRDDSEELTNKLETFNSGTEDSTAYYLEAEERDKEDPLTIEAKEEAERLLDEKLAVNNKTTTNSTINSQSSSSNKNNNSNLTQSTTNKSSTPRITTIAKGLESKNRFLRDN